MTKEQWVKEQLEEQGFITRNKCLQNYVSRLGAIIHSLSKEGWVFKAGYQKYPNGQDYVYTLIRKPKTETGQLFKEHIISV